MSREEEHDAWADLVRRLEEVDSGLVEDTPSEESMGEGGFYENGPSEPDEDEMGEADVRGEPTGDGLASFFADQPFFPTAGDHGEGPRDWQPAEETDEETDYIPEDPPPVMSGRPDRVVGWFLAAGLPVVMIIMLMMGPTRFPPVAWIAGILADLIAWLYLWWTLPAERPDPWDDGAQV